MRILLPPWEAVKRFRKRNAILEIFTVSPDWQRKNDTLQRQKKCNILAPGWGTSVKRKRLGKENSKRGVSVTVKIVLIESEEEEKVRSGEGWSCAKEFNNLVNQLGVSWGWWLKLDMFIFSLLP